MSHLVIKVIDILKHLFNTWFKDFYSLSIINKDANTPSNQTKYYKGNLDKI